MRDFTVSVGIRRFPWTSIVSIIWPPWAAASATGASEHRKQTKISAKGPILEADLRLVSSKNDNIWLPSEQVGAHVGKTQIIRELSLERHLDMYLFPLKPLSQPQVHLTNRPCGE